MAPKRPHKTLTLSEKQDILQKLNSGVSGKALAEKYGVGTSTISDIKKNKEKIMGYVLFFFHLMVIYYWCVFVFTVTLPVVSQPRV